MAKKGVSVAFLLSAVPISDEMIHKIGTFGSKILFLKNFFWSPTPSYAKKSDQIGLYWGWGLKMPPLPPTGENSSLALQE